MSLTITPLVPYAMAAVGPVSFRLPATRLDATPATPSISAIGLVASGRVDLSRLGQLLSLLDLFRDMLQGGLKAAQTPAGQAQAIINAFNHLQAGLEQLSTPGPSGETPAQLFARLLDGLIARLNGGGFDLFASIGIELSLSSTSNDNDSTGRLLLDALSFDRAASDDPFGTLAVLAQLGQILGQAAQDLAGQLNGSATTVSGLLTPDLSRPFGLEQGLPASGTSRYPSLAAAAEVQLTLTANSSLALTTSAARATPLATLQAASPPAVQPAPAALTALTPALPSGAAIPPAGSPPVAPDPQAEARRLAASQALQALIGDPGRQAVANNSFDPAYGALMAAFNLANFVPPGAALVGLASGDLPAAVAPVSPGRAAG